MKSAFLARRRTAVAVLATLQSLETRTLFSANITVVGAGDTSKVIIDGSTIPSFNLTTDFGPTDVHTTTQTRIFYIYNANGTSDLHLTGNPSVTVTGDSSFFVSAQPALTSIAPTATNTDISSFTTVTISFVPFTAGLHNATVSIPTDDPNHPNFTFAISGTAFAATTVTGGTEVMTTNAGSGPAIATGDIVATVYTGYLTTGSVFDSSAISNAGNPLVFQLGAGKVIQGWENGLVGMKSGESRTLIVPASQATGIEGTDKVPAGSTLIFNITLGTFVSHNFLPKLYHDVLGRAADADGLAYWTNLLIAGTTSPAQITSQFIDSTEYRQNRIEAMYHAVLHRDADPDGLNSWLAFFAAGNSVELMEAQFYGSPEFFNDHGATNQSVVEGLYEALLNRPADSGASTWVTQLDAGGARSAVAFSLLRSTEGETNVVTGLYESYLGRAPDAPGLANWVATLQAGASETDIVAAFFSSPEYYT